MIYHIYTPLIGEIIKDTLHATLQTIECLLKASAKTQIIINSQQRNERNIQQMQSIWELPRLREQEKECKYDPEMLKEQILLFQCDSQIEAYLEVQKLQQSPLNQLTSLSFALIKIIQDQLKEEEKKAKKKSECCLNKIENQLMQFPIPTYTSIAEFQQKCWRGMEWVREQRKKLERCCVCMDNRSQIMILPCNHMVMCSDCSKNVIRCPLCKIAIKQRKIIYK